VLALSQTRLTRAAVFGPYVAFTVVLVSWLVLLTAVVPDDSEYLTPTRGVLMVVAMVGIFAAFLVRETAIVKRLLPLVPPIVAVLCVVAVGILSVTHLDTFQTSFGIWQHDLWLGKFWGYFQWPLFAVLTVLSFWAPTPPFSRPLRYGIALFFVLVVLLTTLGDAYGSSRYGSLTRVTLHIVPLIWFYFALVFVPTRSRANRLDVVGR